MHTKLNTLINDLHHYVNTLHHVLLGRVSHTMTNALLRELQRIIDELTGIRDDLLRNQGVILRDGSDHLIDTDVAPQLVFHSLDDAKAAAADLLGEGEPAYDLSVIWIYRLDGTVVARLDEHGWQDDDHA